MAHNLFWFVVSVLTLVGFFVYQTKSENQDDEMSGCEWVVLGAIVSLMSYYGWSVLFGLVGL